MEGVAQTSRAQILDQNIARRLLVLAGATLALTARLVLESVTGGAAAANGKRCASSSSVPNGATSGTWH